MGIFDFFKSKKVDEPHDTITNLSLENLRVGFFVDYDMDTWQVQAAHRYDWGGETSLEWQLTSSQGTLYLGMETDDETEWSLFKSIDFAALDDTVRQALMAEGDPPETITYQKTVYTLQESSGGHFYENGIHSDTAKPQELISWDFENADGTRYLSIEQWGETEFEACVGWPVQEFQFSNILPSP